MILTPKNWKSFQHYQDRKPAWIKLHRGLLDDYDFCCLPVASKALAPFLWLLASEYEGGQINASLDALAFRLRMTRGELADALSPLVQAGFFDASEPLAECKQPAIPEKEREIEEYREEEEEEKKETREVALSSVDWYEAEFRIFWERWPNKVGKPPALKALVAARKRGADFDAIMTGVQSYIRDKPPDRPWLNPATFLNQNRWEDQPAKVEPSTGPPVRPTTVFQQRQIEGREILHEIDQSILRRSSTENPIALRDDPSNGRALVRSGVSATLIDISAKRG